MQGALSCAVMIVQTVPSDCSLRKELLSGGVCDRRPVAHVGIGVGWIAGREVPLVRVARNHAKVLWKRYDGISSVGLLGEIIAVKCQ